MYLTATRKHKNKVFPPLHSLSPLLPSCSGSTRTQRQLQIEPQHWKWFAPTALYPEDRQTSQRRVTHNFPLLGAYHSAACEFGVRVLWIFIKFKFVKTWFLAVALLAASSQGEKCCSSNLLFAVSLSFLCSYNFPSLIVVPRS